MMNFCVVDRLGSELPIEAGTIELEEAHRYVLQLDSSDDDPRVFLGATEIERAADGFPIPISHWVGETNLSIRSDREHHSIAVRVHSRQDKLPDDLWLDMLGDLESWLPGVSVGAEGGKTGEVGASGSTPQLIVEALNPLIPVLERALRRLLEAPREQLVSTNREISIQKIRRPDRATLNWLGRHPEINVWLDPWLESEITGAAPLVPIQRKTVSLDHPANRYIAWLVARVAGVLRTTSKELVDLSKADGVSDDGVSWCVARSNRLARSADRLERVWRRSRLRALKKEPLSEAALQVILDDPIYLRVHRLGRKFLDPRFRLSEEVSKTAAAVRPSYTLYELWCFLEVGRQFRARLPHFDWSDVKHEKLLTLRGSGGGAAIEGAGKDGAIRIEFNPTFPSAVSKPGGLRSSISAERRPDLVVTWRPIDGEGAWVALDAKYRTGRHNLGNAFESVHIYRDSLRYSGFGGACVAAALIAPSMSSDCLLWFSDAFREENDEGIWVARPTNDRSTAVAEWVLQRTVGEATSGQIE